MKTSIIRLGPEYQQIGDAATILIQALSREGLEYVFWPDETVPDDVGDYPDAGGHLAVHLEFLRGVGGGNVFGRVPRKPGTATLKVYVAVTGPA
ncbi:hypothetical protein [Thiocapsa roseopersicina]|uniref:Uncharacterized protein n=1 Tax=Thiocapsa roseopersicina TaxID=1058 RepID=A0A1H3DQ13_THIRO|nr:hypothetical protein [Thiocapsa roseopersicina]SDX68496.1 hypothetical protein SAMN05421783_1558 [Thiocapsa roseopersicina]